MFNSLKALMSGLPSDAYDDEPIGDGFWKDPEYHTKYRPLGVAYRVVLEGRRMLLEIQTKDGQWVQAQRYDHGYDMYGKLHKGRWEKLSGSFADSRDDYRRIGNGLIGRDASHERKVLLEQH